MAELSTRKALEKVRALIRRNPHVEQKLSRIVDVYAQELRGGTGEWRAIINGEPSQEIRFNESDLTINELYAARGYTERHPTGTEFNPEISIDSPGDSTAPQGAFAGQTREETRQQVQRAIEAAGGIPERLPPEPPTIGERVKKLVRMIRLRLRL